MPGREYRWLTRFTPDDRDKLRALLNAVVATSGTNGYSKPLTLEDVTQLTHSLEHKIADDMAAQLAVYDKQERIIAICTLERFPQPDRRHVLDIKRVAILPEVRGRFLKEGLVYVLDHSESMGAELLSLDVSEDGPYALWEHLGFKTIGVMQDYARVGERRLAGYYMVGAINDIRARI